MKLTMTGLLVLLSICACTTDSQNSEPPQVRRPPAQPARAALTIEFRRGAMEFTAGLCGMPFTQPDGRVGVIYVAGAAEIVTADIASARVGRGPWGQSRLELRMAPSGIQKLRALTQAIIGKKLVVLVRGKVLAAVEVQGELGDFIVIEGAFSAQEALALRDELARMSRSVERPSSSEAQDR